MFVILGPYSISMTTYFFLMMVPVLTFLHLVKIVNCLDSFFSHHVTRKKIKKVLWGVLGGSNGRLD